jgi:hypothetical protein
MSNASKGKARETKIKIKTLVIDSLILISFIEKWPASVVWGVKLDVAVDDSQQKDLPANVREEVLKISLVPC